MPTYKVREEESFWHGGKVTKLERVIDGQDVADAVGTGIGWLIASHQKARIANVEGKIKATNTSLEKGDYNQAIKLADELLNLSEKDAQLFGHLIKARAFSSLERYREATTEYTATIEIAKALSAVSDMAFLFWERGLRYMTVNELSSALKDFTNFIQLKPKEDIGYRFQGMALKELGDLKQALVNLNRAIELNPGNAANYRERGLAYVEMKDIPQALQDYSRAIILDPKDASLYKLRADLYSSQKDYQRAITDYSQAIQLDLGQLSYYKLRADIYHLTGEVAKRQADLAHIEHETPFRWAYAKYVNAAKKLFDQGITRAYTVADANATKSNWVGTTITILFVLVPLYFLVTSDVIDSDDVPFLLFMWSIPACAIVIGRLVDVSRNNKETSQRRELARTYLKFTTGVALYLPGLEEFFENYIRAHNENSMKQLSQLTRSFFQEGKGSKTVKLYHQRFLLENLMNMIEQKGDIYLSDIRQHLDELYKKGVIADIYTARVELSRLTDLEEITQIDEDELSDLQDLIQDPEIETIDELIAEMDRMIEEVEAREHTKARLLELMRQGIIDQVEFRILELVNEGMEVHEIAADLQTSSINVFEQLQNIYRKFDTKNFQELQAKLQRDGV